MQAANNAAMLSALNAVHGTGGAPGAVPTSQPPAVPEVNMGDAPQQDSSSAPPPIGRERSTSFKTHKEATERVRRPSSQTQVRRDALSVPSARRHVGCRLPSPECRA